MNVTAASVLSLIAVSTIAPTLADPVIEANRPTMDFEEWTYQSGYVWYELWIFNRGSRDLHIGALGGENPLAPPYSILDGFNECEHQTLQPSAHCLVTIELATNVIGTLVDSFDIASDDPDEPALTITVRARVARSFLDGRLDGISAPAVLWCKNLTTGQVVQQRLGDSTTGNPTTWNCLEASLDANENDLINVLILGAAEADTLEDANSRSDVIPRGAGDVHMSGPNLVVTPAVVDFGRVSTLQTEAAVGVVFNNDNDVPVHFTEIATADRLAEPFFVAVDRLSHEECAPRSECFGNGGQGLEIGMRVAEGLFSDSFSVTTDDPLTPVVTVPVVGEGVADMVTATVVGLEHLVATCLNVTSGQRFQVYNIYPNIWNCTQNGLHANAGDLIVTGIVGLKE